MPLSQTSTIELSCAKLFCRSVAGLSRPFSRGAANRFTGLADAFKAATGSCHAKSAATTPLAKVRRTGRIIGKRSFPLASCCTGCEHLEEMPHPRMAERAARSSNPPH
jgi:hypothetical protein